MQPQIQTELFRSRLVRNIQKADTSLPDSPLHPSSLVHCWQYWLLSQKVVEWIYVRLCVKFNQSYVNKSSWLQDLLPELILQNYFYFTFDSNIKNNLKKHISTASGLQKVIKCLYIQHLSQLPLSWPLSLSLFLSGWVGGWID